MKYSHAALVANSKSRSREGAWIEITAAFRTALRRMGRSREGAWIEIKVNNLTVETAVRRSREGAWIEIYIQQNNGKTIPSLPRGSVD